MKKSILLLFAALLPLMASAKVEIDGIWYNLTAETKQAEVTSGDYSGSITLPATVTYNGVEYSVTSIGNYAFWGCSSLTAITIPEGVTSIGMEAFSGCSSLTSITIPESVTSIGYHAFYNCSSLTAITIPEGVTSIGIGAFYGCSRLTSITIPEGVTSIGNYAFDNCTALKKVIIEDGSTTLSLGYNGSQSLFYDCPLEEVYLGRNLSYSSGSSYGYSPFYNKTKLATLTIGDKVTSIGNYAFYKCSSLTAITIPENSQLTSIGSYAFNNCTSLKELTLGKGIRKIEQWAFCDCTALEKVTTYATRPPTAANINNINIFSDATYENATLYVPQGCIDKYQVMTGWSGFWTIVEMEGGTPNYLTLRQADNGEVGIVVDLGRTYKVRITAFEGWEIHSVTFNGEDVTDQLTEEGTFTTPALSEDAVLNIAYEKSGDNAIEKARASAIKVQGHQGTLRITGTTQGEAISVYTTGGTLVAQESAEGDETLITLPTGQVYIVKVADKVVKIGM